MLLLKATSLGVVDVFATTLTGNLTGNVTGNVTGNLTGDVTGDGSNLTGITSTDSVLEIM